MEFGVVRKIWKGRWGLTSRRGGQKPMDHLVTSITNPAQLYTLLESRIWLIFRNKEIFLMSIDFWQKSRTCPNLNPKKLWQAEIYSIFNNFLQLLVLTEKVSRRNVQKMRFTRITFWINFRCLKLMTFTSANSNNYSNPASKWETFN